MVNLHDIRYVRVGTPDLDSAVRFATGIVGLQLAAREGKAAYFRSDKVAVRGDTRDHTLVYFEGNPADQAIGFDLHDPGDLDAVGAELERAGHQVHFGTREECEQRRVKAFIASHDPSGNRIEFVARPYNSGVRYFPGRDAGVTHFSHIGLYTTDAPRDEKFWTRLCNARVSDWIGDAALLRIDTAHHSLALFPAPRPGIQHINHQVEDVDDVMRSWYFLRDKGIKILLGPGRHPVSTAVMLYFRGPDGMIYEYSCGVKHIMPEDEATYRPRQFPFERYAVCMWGSVPDPEISAFPGGEAAKAAPVRAVLYLMPGPLLSIRNLAVRYGDLVGVADVSLDVAAGSIVALLGSNGAGKTTTLNAISGLVPPASGHIVWQDKEITGLPAYAIIGHGLALSPEGWRLFVQQTVEQNLRLGATVLADKRRVPELLDRVFTLFPRLSERRRQRAGTLSGGERQMLATGRALMSDPKLLMLDEPSLGLAPAVVESMYETLQSLRAAGTTLLLAEQAVELALEVADYAYVLQTGRTVLQGKAADLADDRDVQRIYLGLETAQ